MRGGGPRPDGVDNLQHALLYAVVVDNNDPDKLNRIQVRVPSLDKSDIDKTYWAQYSTTMEGQQFGWYSLPDKDDVVMIMFMDGDFAQPVIIGGVWSTPDEPPEHQNDFRGYRSRKGHRLILDETKKGTKLVFVDKDGQLMLGMGEFAKDGSGKNACEVFRPAGAGSKGISFSAMQGGKVQIHAPDGALKIKGNQKVQISSDTTLDMKTKSFQSDGTATKFSAGAPTNLDASSIKIG